MHSCLADTFFHITETLDISICKYRNAYSFSDSLNVLPRCHTSKRSFLFFSTAVHSQQLEHTVTFTFHVYEPLEQIH